MRRSFGFHDRHSPFRFDPATLFTGGTVQGAWYDPSDFSTLFQDSAGTTTVTAVEQMVGLMLDKSKGLVLGSELVTNGNFSQGSTGWTAEAGWTISGGAASYSSPSTSGFSNLYQLRPVVAGQLYRFSLTVTNRSAAGRIAVRFGGSTFSPDITANGQFVCYLFAPSTGTLLVGVQHIAGGSAGTVTITIDDFSFRELPGNHAFQTTSASCPTLQQTAQGLNYLNFDGSNDSMLTNSINFTGTDKMTVWAGVTKSSDAAQGVVAELSATIASNNGAFLLSAPNSAAANYNWSSKGTTQVDNTVTTYAAPNTTVLTGQANIAGPSNIIRVNGAQAGSVATTQGTGNFGNYPLYIGRRNNATLPLNGRIYGLIVLGAAASDWQVYVTEQWMAGKTGLQF